MKNFCFGYFPEKLKCQKMENIFQKFREIAIHEFFFVVYDFLKFSFGPLCCFFFFLNTRFFSLSYFFFQRLQHFPIFPLPSVLPSCNCLPPDPAGVSESRGNLRAMAKNISLTLFAFLAEVSKKSSPFSSA